jgi:hypothetical protein
MIRTKWLMLIAALVFVAPGVMAQGVIINQAVTAQQIAAVNGGKANPTKLAATADGNLVFLDSSDSKNKKLYLADISKNPPVLTLLADENALRAKVDSVNGAAAAPAAVSPQGIAVDEDGNIIIGSDQSGTETGYVFRLNPTTGELRLLAGLDGPSTQTSVEGVAFIAVRGRTVYVVLEANFGALNGDTVVTVSVDAPDGGQTPAQTFVSEDAFRAALGPVGLTDPLAFRLVGFLPNGNLVLANSAASASSDDLLEIDITTGAVSMMVKATDMEAALVTTDIGPNGGGADPDGTIYLTNAFGAGESLNGVIVVRNTNGQWNSSLLVTQAQVVNSPNIYTIDNQPLTKLFMVNGATVAPAKKTFVFADSNCKCLIRLKEN